jgi:hypothetical protein
MRTESCVNMFPIVSHLCHNLRNSDYYNAVQPNSGLSPMHISLQFACTSTGTNGRGTDLALTKIA